MVDWGTQHSTTSKKRESNLKIPDIKVTDEFLQKLAMQGELWVSDYRNNMTIIPQPNEKLNEVWKVIYQELDDLFDDLTGIWEKTIEVKGHVLPIPMFLFFKSMEEKLLYEFSLYSLIVCAFSAENKKSKGDYEGALEVVEDGYFSFGAHLMAAKMEDKFMAGNSRTSEASAQSSLTAAANKEKAISIYNEMKAKNPRLSKKDCESKIAKTLGVKKRTAYNYLTEK